MSRKLRSLKVRNVQPGNHQVPEAGPPGLTGRYIMSEKVEEQIAWTSETSDIEWVVLYVVGLILMIAAVFVVV